MYATLTTMKVTRIGHACVLLEGGKNILVDPFVTGNPAAKLTLEQIPKLDYILASHDHDDHFGDDALQLAKRDNATLVAIFDITQRDDVTASGIKTAGMNIGGSFEESGVFVSLAPAVHSSKHGSAVGFVIKMDGKTVYHAGDTALFSDMQLIPELFGGLDLALLPIGGYFTMDEAAAARAVNLLQPKLTVPIHYNTWPTITADTETFVRLCGEFPVRVVEPGESFEL